MKILKKFLCLVLPLVMVAVAVLCVVFGGESKAANADEIMTIASVDDYGGQVVISDEDTGAHAAAKDYKAGSIFLEPYSTMFMSGGVISGHQNTYGGAIYVSEGATFTMTAGEISSNKAVYGGAIYVESGGKCYIEGGTIINNSVSEAGGAIFVEQGGIIEIDPSAEITNNSIPFQLTISETKENVGGLNSGLSLYTTTFGSYPQTYVGDSMREELENWFFTKIPTLVKTYTTGDGTEWNAYEYHGDLYARWTENKFDSNSVYKDGTSPVTGRTSWFKVEPIKWYILNYEAWQSGQEEIELYSTEILVAKTPFNATEDKGNDWATSDIRSWCNDKFLKEAFSLKEQSVIQTTTLKNCKTNEYNKDPSTWTGEDTEDKIYLKTFYELYNSQGIFANSPSKMLCSGTDFAIGNYLICASGTSYATNYGVKGGYYWLRSAGSAASYACYVSSNGDLTGNDDVRYSTDGVRPALHLSI